jgi:hypothetical protein
MQVLQAARYSEILEERINQAEKFGIDGDCMQKILEAIHEESVRQQIEVINSKYWYGKPRSKAIQIIRKNENTDHRGREDGPVLCGHVEFPP